jgi:hypothetical protein
VTRRAVGVTGRATLVSLVLAVHGAAAQKTGTPPPVPRFDSGAFRDTRVTNPYFPLDPGTVLVFAIREGTRTSIDSITVTRHQKRIGGVSAVVVHDRVRRNGKILEDTYDWYAQDTVGTVWYLGEATTSFERTKPNTAGSWQHGVAGARAGIIMLAHPAVGDVYRQEYRKGIAEDMGRVVSLSDSASVPAGRYRQCIATEDWSPLEPDVVERKSYCRDAGVVREITTRGGAEVVELVSVQRPRRTP